MKQIITKTLIKSVLYGAMIAVLAHIGGAIPYPYNDTIASWPIFLQTLLFFAAGFAVFFVAVVLANYIRIRMGKGPLPKRRRRRWF